MNTAITQMLGIKYPIFQGAMAWISDAKLAAAVSEAGGLGIIAAGGAAADIVREEIRAAKKLTDKPFGVNIMLMNPEADRIAEMLAEEKPAVVTTGAGNPAKYIAALHAAGIKVFPVVAGVSIARLVARAGADGVIAEGTESGGHIGAHATMSLVPQVARAVEIPVLAAGGIASGAGLAAALCLGAEGVQCGTVFVASAECTASAAYKDMIVKAGDNATAVTGRSAGLPVRGIKNNLTGRILEMERLGAPAEAIEAETVGSLRRAVKEGDVRDGTVMSGQIAGLIGSIRPVADILSDMAAEAGRILAEKRAVFREC
ncbi:MAG: nitronate monooxygenase [Clostridiales bacterium]|jgi:enoyl-[acyl-carrier protein] reductase II|nr:nitronate monooxygenase [Clostridiales bacterium]